MKSILIAGASAAAVVALFAALRGSDSGEGGPGPDAWRPPEAAPMTTVRRPTGPYVPPGPYVAAYGGMEAEHRKRGALGDSVKRLMEATFGSDWKFMDRLQAAKAMHTLLANYRPEDADYLLQTFRDTKDPAFRWWFAALARQLKDDRFADAVAEVYAIDPVQAGETLGWMGGPKAIAHLTSFIDRHENGDERATMFGALARSTWAGKEDYFARVASDEDRNDVDRMHALVALGREGVDPQSLRYLTDLATGRGKPVESLGNLDMTHPVKDIRSAAVLGVMQRGNQDAVRTLLEAAEVASADPTFVGLVESHLATYSGPDLSEYLFVRAARRRKIGFSELYLIQRSMTESDLARFRALLPYAADDAARKFIEESTAEQR